MKKVLFLATILVALYSCSVSKKNINNNEFLIGFITKENLEKEPNKEWFCERYKNTEVDKKLYLKLKMI